VEGIERGLRQVHPKLRETVTRRLAATVAAVLPRDTERADMRLQWTARLLANELAQCAQIVEPFARECLRIAAASRQTVVLSMDQTDLGDRFAILMLSVRVGERALPSIWATRMAPPTSDSRPSVPCWRSILAVCRAACRRSWRPIASTLRRRCLRGCTCTAGAIGCARKAITRWMSDART
jgi:hypothetical protein